MDNLSWIAQEILAHWVAGPVVAGFLAVILAWIKKADWPDRITFALVTGAAVLVLWNFVIAPVKPLVMPRDV